MKKIGKKISYLIKVFLVLGLSFSNMILPLKTVFAYEAQDEVLVGENEENLLDDENAFDEMLDEISEEDENANLEEELLENDESVNLEDEESLNVFNEDEEELENQEEAPQECNYTDELNDSAKELELDRTYYFVSEKMYVVVGVNNLEVASIVNNAFDDVTHEIVENELVLTDGDKTIVYEIVIYNEESLERLLKVIAGSEEETLEDDINNDELVNFKDAVTLRQVLKNGFGSVINSQNVVIESKFDGDTDNLSVGDTFTVRYVLTLSEYAVDGISGLINYNKDMLNLDKVEVVSLSSGESYEGKFVFFGDALRGTEIPVMDEEEVVATIYDPTDYIIVEMTFTAVAPGNDTLTIDDVVYSYEDTYYEGNTSGSLDITVLSSDNRLLSVTIGGNEIVIDELTDEYELNVDSDVVETLLEYVLSSTLASISSIVAPEELTVGENVITIVVVAENGDERTYTITVNRVKEEDSLEDNEELETVTQVNYQNSYNNYNDTKKEEKIEDKKEDQDEETVQEEDSDDGKLSKVIIIALILLAIAGLIYLIFRDEPDAETKRANKEIGKLKNDDLKEFDSKKNTNDKKTKKKER